MTGSVSTTESAYHPLGVAGTFAVTVTSSVQTLGQLLATASKAIPIIAIEGNPKSFRFPTHLLLQSTFGNADSIYMTMDNVTAPVSSVSPTIGWEITPGGFIKIPNVAPFLENGEGVNVGNNTAFKFIADDDTYLAVIFTD